MCCTASNKPSQEALCAKSRRRLSCFSSLSLEKFSSVCDENSSRATRSINPGFVISSPIFSGSLGDGNFVFKFSGVLFPSDGKSRSISLKPFRSFPRGAGRDRVARSYVGPKLFSAPSQSDQLDVRSEKWGVMNFTSRRNSEITGRRLRNWCHAPMEDFPHLRYPSRGPRTD